MRLGPILLILAAGVGLILAAAAPLVLMRGAQPWMWSVPALFVLLLAAGLLLSARGR